MIFFLARSRCNEQRGLCDELKWVRYIRNWKCRFGAFGAISGQFGACWQRANSFGGELLLFEGVWSSGMEMQHKEDTEGHKIARKDIGNQCKCRCRCMLLDPPVGAWGILMAETGLAHRRAGIALGWGSLPGKLLGWLCGLVAAAFPRGYREEYELQLIGAWASGSENSYESLSFKEQQGPHLNGIPLSSFRKLFFVGEAPPWQAPFYWSGDLGLDPSLDELDWFQSTAQWFP